MISQRMAHVMRTLSLSAVLLMLGACAGSPEPAERPAVGVGQHAVSIALRQVGVPYRYGGQNPGGFDCSGLVHYSYQLAGKSVPRTTGQLWDATENVGRSSLEPGDLLFFSINGKMQHVGLYIGNDQFVHAPSSGKVVSVASLSQDYYRRAFLRAGRPR